MSLAIQILVTTVGCLGMIWLIRFAADYCANYHNHNWGWRKKKHPINRWYDKRHWLCSCTLSNCLGSHVRQCSRCGDHQPPWPWPAKYWDRRNGPPPGLIKPPPPPPPSWPGPKFAKKVGAVFVDTKDVLDDDDFFYAFDEDFKPDNRPTSTGPR